MVRVGVAVRGAQTASGHEEYTAQGPHFDSTWNNFTVGRSLRSVWLEVTHEWTASGVCTYIDNELVVCENYRWVDNSGNTANPANVLLNLAVGGEWAGRHGIDDTEPMQMDVDYLRVHKKAGSAIATPTTSSPTQEPNGSESGPDDPWYQRWFFWR